MENEREEKGKEKEEGKSHLVEVMEKRGEHDDGGGWWSTLECPGKGKRACVATVDSGLGRAGFVEKTLIFATRVMHPI